MVKKKQVVNKKVQKASSNKAVQDVTSQEVANDAIVKQPTKRKILLKASHIRKAFDGNEVLRDVCLEVREGEVLLLQGENGSGKTTLINILTGNLEPDKGRITLATDGKNVEHFLFPRPFWRSFLPFTYFSPERFAREGMGRMWQDVRLFKTQTLKDNIAVATPNQTGENPLSALVLTPRIKRDENEQTQKARKILSDFGLAGREDSLGARISLGQSKRVAVSRAIQAGAKILVLDEPLAGLDNNGIEKMMEFLHYLVKECHTSIVIVEHAFNIPKILDLVDGVLTLKDGAVTRNTKEEVFAKENTKEHKDAMLEWLTSFAGKKGKTDIHYLPNGARLTIARRDPAAPSVFSVNNLTVNRGHRPVIVDPLSFDIHKGDIAMLEAPNGWGKSTLMDAIMGVIDVKTGSITLHGERITNKPIWARARKGLLLSRSGDVLFKSVTVNENKRLARVKKETDPKLLNRLGGSLSGGENRRISLSLALYQHKKDIVLLDEPFQAMDTTQEEIARGRISLEAHKDKTFLITIPKIYG